MNACVTTRRGADCAITGRVATTAHCDKNVARTRHIIPARVRFAFGFAPLGQAPAARGDPAPLVGGDRGRNRRVSHRDRSAAVFVAQCNTHRVRRRHSRARGLAAGVSRIRPAGRSSPAGSAEAHGGAFRSGDREARPRCESRGVGHRAGAPRGRDPLRQPRRRGRRCLRLSQRGRAARLGQTRHRPVLRGGTALAECRRFIRAARLPARRERRHGPDRGAGPAAADGVRGSALGLWTLSRRAALRRTPRARNLLARSTPDRGRPGAGRGGARGLQSSGRLRIPRRDGGRTGGGVLDLGACRGVATDRRQHAWRGRAVGHRDPDPPEPVAARRVSLAARSLPRAKCESGWCANGDLCVGERSGSARHRVHQSAHPRVRIHLGLWRSRHRLRAPARRTQPQALLGMVAREPGDHRPVVRLRPVAMARRHAPRGGDPDRVCTLRGAALSLLPAIRSVVVPALHDSGDSDRAAAVCGGGRVADAVVHRALARPR